MYLELFAWSLSPAPHLPVGIPSVWVTLDLFLKPPDQPPNCLKSPGQPWRTCVADFIPLFIFFNIFEVFVLTCKTLYNLVPPSRRLNSVTFYVVLPLPSGYISMAHPDLLRGMFGCFAGPAAGWEEKGCVW